MRSIAVVFASLVALICVARAEDPKTLTIYTYESFVSEWGPGPAIQKGFERQCSCRIEWVGLEDGAALLSRVKLEGDQTKADIVLGLDNNLTAEAVATGLFAKSELDLTNLKLPSDWSDDYFVPFDYGYFAFVFDSAVLTQPPKSFAELTGEGDAPKMILMDPRTSTPGLGLLLWVKALYGEEAIPAWQGIYRRTVTVTKSWSEAYGLFLKGEAPLVLSYTTSPAYHQMMENTGRYRAAIFEEGQYLQVEVAGRVADSDQPELATDFLRYLISRPAQQVIPTTNWMFPVIELGDALPQAFRDLPAPAKILALAPETIARHRTEWINEWLEASGN